MNICILIGAFRSDAAYRVMTECTSQLKRRIHLYSLAEKLSEKKIINPKQKSKATDELSGRTTDQRMDELLDIVKESIEVEGKVFGYILEILKDEDTILTNTLYDDMMKRYRRYVDERVSIDKGNEQKNNITLGPLKFGVFEKFLSVQNISIWHLVMPRHILGGWDKCIGKIMRL